MPAVSGSYLFWFIGSCHIFIVKCQLKADKSNQASWLFILPSILFCYSISKKKTFTFDDVVLVLVLALLLHKVTDDALTFCLWLKSL